MNFFLEITKGDFTSNILSEYGPMETLLFGGKILLIGMVAVFAVLTLIWFTLSIFNKVFAKQPEQKAVAPVKVSAPAAPAPKAAASSDEIVAVIAAAIAMAESEGSGAKYRVVSFKRK